MTVSRVINGHDNVKKETREKVIKAIEELSYYPNAAARALNMNRTNVLGIIVPHDDYFFSSHYFVELLFSIEKRVKSRNYNLIFNISTAKSELRDYAILYKERKVDGLIIIAPLIGDIFIEKLIDENVPFVLVNGRHGKSDIDFVDVNNIKGAEEVISYLVELGHRRIGFISGKLNVINGRHRLQGYKKALKYHHIDLDEKLIYEGNWSADSGYQALSHFLTLDPPPTAIFCSNDLIAMGVIKAANNHHLKIPDDISIVGFDDIHLASFTTPSLTTMRQPIEMVGKRAADIIIDSLTGKLKNKEKVILDPELIVRSSCRKII